MARSCLFTFRLAIVVASKNKLRFQVFKNHYAQIHKQVLLRQYEANIKEDISKNDISKNDSDEPRTQRDFKEVNIEELKIKILNASLAFVPEYGWSERALALGVQSLGLSVASHSLIKHGGPELVHYFNFSCNAELEDYLKKKSSSNTKINLQEFLSDALENRLRMIIPYLPKWPEAMALMALPTQLPIHTGNVLDLVDSIWHFYGDTSLNISWYGKRLALAVAYKTSELSIIQDKSEDFSNTIDFLQNRVEDIIETKNFIHSVNENGKHLLEFGSGAFITARNLLGLNKWFR